MKPEYTVWVEDTEEKSGPYLLGTFPAIEPAVQKADESGRDQPLSVRLTVTHAGTTAYTTHGTNRALTDAIRKQKAEAQAEALVDGLGKFVNGMSREQFDAFATALANEHPTLLGQIAKAVGTGVMRRATYNPEWRNGSPDFGGDTGRRVCERRSPEPHVEHDGRLDCTTIVGAALMARQSYI